MAKRSSKKVLAGVTEAEFNEAMATYAMADAQHAQLTARLDQELTKVRDKYAENIAAKAEEREAAQEVVMAYCVENKGTLFAQRRSINTEHGVVGFRLGTPKLKTLPKWNWDKVRDKVASVLPDFLRVKTEVDKEGILNHRHDDAVAPYLNQVGVYVDQDEAFFIELKKEVLV